MSASLLSLPQVVMVVGRELEDSWVDSNQDSQQDSFVHSVIFERLVLAKEGF
jgi:hypothetical protein